MELIGYKAFEGVKIIRQKSFVDDRGSFLKAYQKKDFLPNYHIEQINFVQSAEKHTLRGLHFQFGEYAESKLFRVVKGEMIALFVDLRKASDTFLQGDTFHLKDRNEAILLPRGFATGYLTLEDNCEVLYLSDNIYVPGTEGGVRWDDPKINLSLPVTKPVISDKDISWDHLSDGFPGIFN